jgi:serine/threonine protein kinase
MLGKLLVTAGPDQGQVFPLEEGQTLLIGRGQDTPTKFKDQQVSRKHGEIKVEGGKALFTNLSKSGTAINGKRVDRQELKHGDLIQMGTTQLRVQFERAHEATTVVVSGTPAAPKAVAEKAEQLSELVGQSVSHYQVESVIAKGQSGMVFKAQDTKENRTVALKVLWPEFSRNDEEMQRFIRAMKTMLPIRHPNLVALYAAGKTGPYCWMAMEFVEGESLTQFIKEIGTAGRLDWRPALRVAIHVSRGLDFAQQHNVIHRNITPSNIMVQASDKLTKLGDLMLAKALEGTQAAQITRPGELVGDVAYMSPERTRGGTATVDGRSDIYSLGATVYALLTGRPPFDAGSLPETIMKIRQEEPVKPKKYQLSIPDLFEGTVLKMLAKRPEDRFQTAGELLAELERVAKYQGLTF